MRKTITKLPSPIRWALFVPLWMMLGMLWCPWFLEDVQP